MSDWRDFERLAERIYRELTPHAMVTWNDHLHGHDSETDRQIDVSIRWSDRDQEYVTIVQTKDWSSPADLPAVGEFAAVVEDVRATRGVMVCRSGFTQNARTYARNKGIGLYNLHDAESRSWRLDLTIPLLWIDLYPSGEFSCQIHLVVGEELLLDDGLPLLFTDPGETRINPITVFEQLWNHEAIPHTPGAPHTLRYSGSLSAPINDINGDRAWRSSTLEMVYEVDRRAWLGQFTPDECRGLVDYLRDNAFTASHLPIGQVPVERDEGWVEIDDPDGVSLNTRGTLVTTLGFEIAPGAGALYDQTVIWPGEQNEDDTRLDQP